MTGTLNTTYSVAVYDIDLFDTPASTIASLRAANRRVVCYFSAGSSENWRSDFSSFAASDMGKPLEGWAGEKWLDVRSATVRAVMLKRLDLAKSKGCDGVDPDNVDGYTQDSGFPTLTAADQLNYNRFLADQAHARGLAVALKNDVDQLAALEPSFDMAVNEQCHQYNECGAYSVFTNKNKPVFNVEYSTKYRQNTNGARDAMCTSARAANLRTMVMPANLDGTFRTACD